MSPKEIPFAFGKTADARNFANRASERKQLAQNFNALVNTIIVSPRRWGKTSLVGLVAEEAAAKNPKLRICQVDVFNVRSELEFYAQLAKAVLGATSSKIEELAKNAKDFLGKLNPKISFTPDAFQGVSLDIDWSQAIRSPDEILDLAENIAKAKKIKIVVCIDEFQSIANFPKALEFQRKLRSHWQHHQHVSYCLYGSKRHMLLDIFTTASMPFYRFGDIMMLSKITNTEWGEFIVKRFVETGKNISAELAQYLADLVDNHSYYVQQLAQQSWLRSTRSCNKQIIDTALAALVDQLSLLFVNLQQSLTSRQVRLLFAIMDGEKELSSQAVLQKYDLGTSANVIRLKAGLQDREIIDVLPEGIEILDPLFKRWLATIR